MVSIFHFIASSITNDEFIECHKCHFFLGKWPLSGISGLRAVWTELRRQPNRPKTGFGCIFIFFSGSDQVQIGFGHAFYFLVEIRVRKSAWLRTLVPTYWRNILRKLKVAVQFQPNAHRNSQYSILINKIVLSHSKWMFHIHTILCPILILMHPQSHY